MLEIHAVRHLPTRLNELGVLQGHWDEKILEPSGQTLLDIQSNLKKLERFRVPEKVFTSTLIRTKMTAEVYGFCNTIQDPLLDELNFGPYEKRPKSEMLQELGELWVTDPGSLILGEPVVELEARVRAFIDACSKLQSVLIFGHGTWIRALCSIAARDDLSEMNTMYLENNELRLVCIE